MKKEIALMAMALLVMAVVPSVLAAGIGTGFGGGIIVEEFQPIVWQCGDRILTDEEIQPWRVSEMGTPLVERANSYLFEGEIFSIDVVVFDKNKIQDVVVDLFLESYDGDDLEINCVPMDLDEGQFRKCNARIGEETITAFDSSTMQAYVCTVTVAESEVMYGEYSMYVQADDGNEIGMYDELADWFMNPIISLDTGDAALDFEDVRPGTASYDTVQLRNEAEGGVLLDMFIAGKNWYSLDDGGNLGRCYDKDRGTGGSLVNYLPLSAFTYYAENGAYSTRQDALRDNGYSSVRRAKDAEGYVNINYQINDGFDEAMFDDAEIIQAGTPVYRGLGYRANVIYPGSTGMAITIRLMLPEPCYGEFEAEEGITFWAEAI